MKIVINRCYGGFGLSKQAYAFLGLKPDECYSRYTRGNNRTEPKLIECIERLGAQASGYCAKLKVIEIPDDVEWVLVEWGGFERIVEKHRTWE